MKWLSSVPPERSLGLPGRSNRAETVGGLGWGMHHELHRPPLVRFHPPLSFRKISSSSPRGATRPAASIHKEHRQNASHPDVPGQTASKARCCHREHRCPASRNHCRPAPISAFLCPQPRAFFGCLPLCLSEAGAVTARNCPQYLTWMPTDRWQDGSMSGDPAKPQPSLVVSTVTEDGVIVETIYRPRDN